MSDKMEWLRGWAAPALLVGLVVQGVGLVTHVNGVGNTAANTARDLTKVETRVLAIETASTVSGTKLAVVESQLSTVLKLVERIDARMEAERGG